MTVHYLYIARCRDNSLYIGVSNNPTERTKRHNRGQGAKWIKQHGEARVVYTEEFNTYLEAHRRELQIKRWSRTKKENLIKGLKPWTYTVVKMSQNFQKKHQHYQQDQTCQPDQDPQQFFQPEFSILLQ